MAAIEFVAMTISRPGRLLKVGMAFKSSLTMGWLSGRSARSDAISSASSMKQTMRSTRRSSSSVWRRAAAPAAP